MSDGIDALVKSSGRVSQVTAALQKRTALVTGASFGIGAAIALELARDDFALAITARHLDHLKDVLGKIAPSRARVTALELELRSVASVERAGDAAIEALGHVDVLVNNAAMPLRKAAVEVTAEEWNAVIETNVAGTFFLCQKIARHLIASGRPGCIINMASTHGVVGHAGVSVYGISKAAIIHMTKMLAVEWAQYGIRVNAVAPGTVETDSRRALLADHEFRESVLSKVPLHRFATPEEVAAAVRYLASPAAGYVTGEVLLLDGGVCACGSRGVGPK
jgi:NAD(P)-dependent dehydrogenase (short-subunit alcohol dehydrogenase family)